MVTEVVAALIWKNDHFLACQRPAHKSRGLLWEFVGGKVEPGETKEAALVRECHEELNVQLIVHELFMEVTHTYPDLTVHLSLFNAEISDGEPQMLEHNDIRWITTEEIDNYDFCPADDVILARLKTIETELQARLLSLKDPLYRDFQCTLMPTVDPEKVLGVRVPALRALAKQNNGYDWNSFFRKLPHRFYEEDMIHGILINQIREPEAVLEALETFLPFIDNWAVCDIISPTAFKRTPEMLLQRVLCWLQHEHAYTVRYAIGVLMKYYSDGSFDPEHLSLVANVGHDDYYVRMMIAWYFATALAKQYESVISFLENRKLSAWTHNKTIQKAIESYRIPEKRKVYLKSLRIKGEAK